MNVVLGAPLTQPYLNHPLVVSRQHWRSAIVGGLWGARKLRDGKLASAYKQGLDRVPNNERAALKATS